MFSGLWAWLTAAAGAVVLFVGSYFAGKKVSKTQTMVVEAKKEAETAAAELATQREVIKIETSISATSDGDVDERLREKWRRPDS